MVRLDKSREGHRYGCATTSSPYGGLVRNSDGQA